MSVEKPFHESMKLQTAHNELPLFLVKDMNQLKTNLHIINPKPQHSTNNNQQENLHSKANSQKSFQIQLAHDQSKTDAHSINPINLNGIRFSFVWKLGSENFHSSKHCFHSVIRRRTESKVAESIIKI